jgi:L-lactate dehydrogenase complex protein LldF
VHLVLLDNGRSQAYADEQLRATLQCIRCGACMNHCPVYTRIGGHAYGTTYPGPIGKIISPHLLGLDATADLATASSLCGACGESARAHSDSAAAGALRTEANRNPDEAVPHPLKGQGAKFSRREHLVWRFWSGAFAHPTTYRLFRWAATRLRALTPSRQMGWTQHRKPLTPAPRAFPTCSTHATSPSSGIERHPPKEFRQTTKETSRCNPGPRSIRRWAASGCPRSRRRYPSCSSSSRSRYCA